MAEISQYSLKYRPRYFRDVFGQDTTVKALQKRIKENNLPQAICLKGPYGCGKSSLAFIVAAAMMAHDEEGEPLWDTPDGRSVYNQTFDRDVMLLDASRWSSKDAMIEFTQSIACRPMYSKSGIRVCIIEEADQASNAAMLSLLKILESSKPYNKFILCSMEEKGVPQSVLSRCQVYKINSIGTADMMRNLKHIMEESGSWTDPKVPQNFKLEGLATIAGCSEGSMRNAVQYLEQCLINEVYNKDDIEALLGIVDEEATWRVLDGLLQKTHDDKVWNTIMRLKTGDQTMHFYNYACMMLSEALLVRETGAFYDESTKARLVRMGNNPNCDSLYYCLTLHPQMNKPFIRTSDLLGALVCYYQNMDFRPKPSTVVNAEPKVILTDIKPEAVTDMNVPAATAEPIIEEKPKIRMREAKKPEEKLTIGVKDTPPISGASKEGMAVRTVKPDVGSMAFSQLQLAF